MRETLSDEVLWTALEARNPWWGGGWEDTSIRREALDDLRPWLDRPEARVVAIVGLRRCGKTTLMQQGVAHLVRRGTPSRHVLWLSLEDPVFDAMGRGHGAFDRCLALHAARLDVDGPVRLFLDELQLADAWPTWVRTAHETGRARIVASGSSAELLEPELDRGLLSGRVHKLRLWPLSFREFLRFRGFDAGRRGLRTVRDAELATYLERGGLPEVAIEDDPALCASRLRDVYDGVLLRDVALRHEIRNLENLRTVAAEYLRSTGNRTTFRRVKDRYRLGIDRVREFASYLEEAYLVRFLAAFSDKQHERATRPRKVYAVDTGLRQVAAFARTADRGALAETAAFGMLLRNGSVDDGHVFYSDVGGECDFLVFRGGDEPAAIQVCFQGAGPLPPRELAGLQYALDVLAEGLPAGRRLRGLVLTEGFDEPPRSLGRYQVRVRRLSDWLLDDE